MFKTGMKNQTLLLPFLMAALLHLNATAHAEARPAVFSGNVYMQANTTENQVVHFHTQENGQLVEVERVDTYGAGTGGYKPVTGQNSAPNDFESVGSVILSPDHHLLFVTNGGDNTVSSFRIHHDGRPEWVDTQKTGQAISGRSGSANSLAYAAEKNTLYVGHIFGPDHIHLLTVLSDGHLVGRDQNYTVNTGDLTDRLPTQVILSPDHRFLIANILFDHRPTTNADGSVNLQISNNLEKNGMAVFPVSPDGSLGTADFQDGGGLSPFFTQFLNGSNDKFIELFAVSDGAMLGHLTAEGKIETSPVVSINNAAGKPSEICWASLTPDNKYFFTADLAYSTVSSYSIDHEQIAIKNDPAAPPVAGDGTFDAIDGHVTSSPVDNWISADGKYFYQIYPNASQLVSYRIHSNGSLETIGVTAVPYNTSQGLAGY